jgi:hypothetical protein
VVGKMLIGYPPLLKAFIPLTYHASLRPQAHQGKDYSALRSASLLYHWSEEACTLQACILPDNGRSVCAK